MEAYAKVSSVLQLWNVARWKQFRFQYFKGLAGITAENSVKGNSGWI